MIKTLYEYEMVKDNNGILISRLCVRLNSLPPVLIYNNGTTAIQVGELPTANAGFLIRLSGIGEDYSYSTDYMDSISRGIEKYVKGE